VNAHDLRQGASVGRDVAFVTKGLRKFKFGVEGKGRKDVKEKRSAVARYG